MGQTYYPEMGASKFAWDVNLQDISRVNDADVTNWYSSRIVVLCTNIVSGGKDTTGCAYKLQWRDETDNPGGSFTDVGATGEVKWATSSEYETDGSAPYTNYVVETTGDTRTTGLASVGDNRIPDSGTFDMGDDQYAEFHWVLDLSDANVDHQYTFQLYNITQGAAVGIAGARITVIGSPPAITLNTADSHSFSTSTPTLEFTGTDNESDDVRYAVLIFDHEPGFSITYPAGEVYRVWQDAGADNGKFILCSFSTSEGEGRIYYYDGSSWSEEQPAGDTDKQWSGCDMDGGNMIACAIQGRLYFYNGSFWSEEQPAGDSNMAWKCCAISGNKMIAGVENGRLYFYDGSSWSEENPGGSVDFDWQAVDMDGSNMMACVDGGRLYYYNGSSWAEQTPGGSTDLDWADVSLDGTKRLAVVTNGRAYYYNGSSWSELIVAGLDCAMNWKTCTLRNGRILLTETLGTVYYFDGYSWNIFYPSGYLTSYWYAAALDEHGNALAAEWGYEVFLGDFTIVLEKVSGTDSGFANTVTGTDTDPFNSGEKVSFTVQSEDALANGTYYWQVAAADPSGTGDYSFPSATRSFTVSASAGSDWDNKIWSITPSGKVHGVSLANIDTVNGVA